MNPISQEILKQIPLMKESWMPVLNRMRENLHAPRWNGFCGDRLISGDLPVIENFEKNLTRNRKPAEPHPPEEILDWIETLRLTVPWFNQVLKPDWRRTFTEIPCLHREILQKQPEALIPSHQDLSRMVLNATSGTTGTPIAAPNHPASVGCYDPMIAFVLQRHGVETRLSEPGILALQLCAQQNTLTYNTVHAYLNGAGFAKINLHPNSWKNPQDPEPFISAMAPVFFSGDPFAFLWALEQGISYRPKALLSSALTLETSLRQKLEKNFQCPVADFYSLNETGPIAYSCPHHPEMFHLLPHDLFLETLDEKGFPVPTGQRGEICVTGGRNPFIPLLRYRTGDTGILIHEPCSCGDPHPRIAGLEARKPVLLQNSQNEILNPVDISRILRTVRLHGFQFIQKKPGWYLLRITPSSTLDLLTEKKLIQDLKGLTGNPSDIEVVYDLNLKENKAVPFVKEA